MSLSRNPNMRRRTFKMNYRCPWCEADPEPTAIGSTLVFCPTPGCPAFSNVVTVDIWNSRAPNELLVRHIPSDEPIFVLRARDPLALIPIYTWIDLAEKKKVNEAKINRAVGQAEEFQTFQRGSGTKLPD
jgi:hypothetical protein